ncbi:MAG: hypothetical protein JKX99_10085 [Robiginitomaculum sp.]|nr:hypothetical protein [Robiginitomaculum sp.]
MNDDLKEACDLLVEITYSHCNKDSWDYNHCEDDPCDFCNRVMALIKEVKDNESSVDS